VAYGLGTKVIRRLCEEQSSLQWFKAKLRPVLFKPYEQDLFEWVSDHVRVHHTLPQLVTIETQFPDVAAVATPEPSSYYLLQLEQQYCYERLNKANLDSQAILKEDQTANEAALEVQRTALREIVAQKFRARILDVGKEAGDLVLHAYHHTPEYVAEFGWPYLDQQSGGVMPGDVISFVGRPAAGKTWLTLWTALHNWAGLKLNVLFASMEMATLPVAQRITSLYTHQNIAQLKMSGYSQQTMAKFTHGLKFFKLEEASMYLVDANLATSAEDLFDLAEMLKCKVIFIDGAYLLRHQNLRLDRYTRAAENVELIKRYCSNQEAMAFCSWQFNREASKKQKKGKGDQGGLEDIGYSDAIGQISSIALSLYQEDGIETLKERKVKVLKGRNGEVGQFSIAWDFTAMTFKQLNPAPEEAVKVFEEPQDELSV